jgi:uncharacterized protein YecE (DUF72 family)
MQVWVGTSGYSYGDWVGSFYPTGTRPNRMLPYYCTQFPLVELNFTFYRPPSADILSRMAEQTPPGFQFLVKMPRTISHEQDPRDLPGFRAAVDPLRQRGQLAGVLCQLPQSAHNEHDQRDWLDRIAQEMAGCRLAVEFRHRSWNQPEVRDWLRTADVDLVSVDVPDLPGLYPSGLVQSTSRIYVRLHSRAAPNWYASDKERYDYNYDDPSLNQWIEALDRAENGTAEALFLFNNCQRSNAPQNARRMQELLERFADRFKVMPPLAVPPEPVLRQQFLFGEES